MIPMEPIIDVAAEAGVKHCHVEQDHSPHPIESIQYEHAILDKSLDQTDKRVPSTLEPFLYGAAHLTTHVIL